VSGLFAPHRATASLQLFQHIKTYPGPSSHAVFPTAPPAPLGYPPTADHLVVHRLDEGTSGITLYPLSPAASVALSRSLRQRSCRKVYEAVVDTRALPRGSPLARGATSGEIHLPLRRKVGVALLHEASLEGKPSATTWRLLEVGAGCARLELSPASGRTHQLRIHCAEGLGAPIVGDNLYGADDLCAAPFHRELRERGPGVGGAAPDALAAVEARAADALARLAAAGWGGRFPVLPSCPHLREGATAPPRLLLHAKEIAVEDSLGGGGAGGGPRWGGARRLLCASWSPLANGAEEVGTGGVLEGAGLRDLTHTVVFSPPSAEGALFAAHEESGPGGTRWVAISSVPPF
jgi:23S rRNA-/tRNA-specific pseudouridylate synthase